MEISQIRNGKCLENKVFQINENKSYMKSQRLNQHIHVLHRSAAVPLCIYYSFQFTILWCVQVCKQMGLWSLGLLLGSFSFHWFVLSNFNMIVLFYLIIFQFYHTLKWINRWTNENLVISVKNNIWTVSCTR